MVLVCYALAFLSCSDIEGRPILPHVLNLHVGLSLSWDTNPIVQKNDDEEWHKNKEKRYIYASR